MSALSFLFLYDLFKFFGETVLMIYGDRDGEQLDALRLQHNKECKGLIVQIRYLKAKFTRESARRGDLSYQKAYLLALLARLEHT